MPCSSAADLEDDVLLASVAHLLGGQPRLRRLGRFRLLRRIAHGGQATVYEAVEDDSVERIALRVLHRAADRATVARLDRLCALEHPNLPRVRGVHPIAGMTALSLELRVGRPILQALSGLEQGERWILQVADALCHLHDHGWVHGDVSPSNIVVGDGGLVTLLDFGLVQPVVLGGARRDAGTPGFYRPGSVVDRRSDWYGLGKTLLACVEALPGMDACVRRLGESLCSRGLDPDRAHALLRGTLGDADEDVAGEDEVEAVASALVRQDGQVGKVTLAGALGADLARRTSVALRRHHGAAVVSVRCREEGGADAVDQIAEQLCELILGASQLEPSAFVPRYCAELRRVVPAFRRLPALGLRPASDEQEVVRRAALGLCEVLERLAARVSVVIWIDDAQWMELRSEALLSSAFARVESGRVGVLSSGRGHMREV